jgi:hypothetical protein
MLHGLHRLILLLPLGCGIQTVGELESAEGGGDAGAGSTGGAETSSASASSASQSATSSSPSTSASTATPGTESGEDSGSTTESCVGPNNCGPVTEDQHATFMIEGGVPPLFDLEIPCLITDVTEIDDRQRIAMDCTYEDGVEARVIEVDLHAVSLLNLYAGRDVLFDHGGEQPMWTEQWFTLRSEEGDLLLGGSEGSRVTIPLDGGLGFAPLFPAVNDDDCGVDPCLDDTGCFYPQKASIDFPFEGETNRVIAGGELVFGETTTYRVRVQQSQIRHDVICDDVPDEWHVFLVENISEG